MDSIPIILRPMSEPQCRDNIIICNDKELAWTMTHIDLFHDGESFGIDSGGPMYRALQLGQEVKARIVLQEDE